MKRILILSLLTISSLNIFCAEIKEAASELRPQDYITAAILVNINDPSTVDLLNKLTKEWDDDNTKKLGNEFRNKRTLLGTKGYHMTLVDFEFDTQNMSEEEKKTLIEASKITLSQLIKELLPAALVSASYSNFSPRSNLNNEQWKLKSFALNSATPSFKIVLGAKRPGKIYPPKYFVIPISQIGDNYKWINQLREKIINYFIFKFPKAIIRKEFLPHISLARTSPRIKLEDINIPKINLGFIDHMSPENITVNAEERGPEAAAKIDEPKNTKERTIAFIKAAKQNLTNLAMKLLKNGIDINAEIVIDEEPTTPLIEAIESRNKDLVLALIDSGANIEQKTSHGADPLTVASLESDEIYQILEDKLAGIKKSEFGLRPTISTKSIEPKTNQERAAAFVKAVQSGKSEEAKRFLQLGIDVNAVIDETTPLATASLAGNEDLVSSLIKSKANVNQKTKLGITPIQAAQMGANPDPVIARLLGAGANI